LQRLPRTWTISKIIGLNARIIGPDDATRISFHAGDGIEHLLTDRNGTIWTGYFDEVSICAQPTARNPTGTP
jgi:hypothetical protein